MDCYICSSKSTTLIKYSNKFGETRCENRCKSCAEAIRNNQSIQILSEKFIGNIDTDINHSDENSTESMSADENGNS